MRKFCALLFIVCLPFILLSLLFPLQIFGQASEGGSGSQNPVYVPGLNVADEYSLPTVDGSASQCMKTDGNGVVTWEECAGGGGGGAPTDATYITQTADATLTNEQALSGLSTGLMKVTTGTGQVTSLTDNTTNWDTAFGWGDHSLAGYITSAGVTYENLNANSDIGQVASTVAAGDDGRFLSSAQKTDLTDGNDSSAHYHSADRSRANHSGTQAAATISDFDTEVSNNTDVSANTSARHSAVTLAGKDYLTLSTQEITANAIDLTDDVSGALPITNGGSGQTTQQAAIDALTNVSGATNEHVLTKDTGTGNAIWKAAAGGGGLTVGDAITSGTANRVLFEDGSNQLAESASLVWDGSLGIGTTGPDRLLDVLDASNPQLRLTHTNESEYIDFQSEPLAQLRIYSGSTPIFHLFAPSGANGENIFIGENAGNFTQSGTSFYSSRNIGVGAGALASLTTGYDTSAFGVDAFANLEDGSRSFAMGTRAMYSAISGTDAVGIGVLAGNSATNINSSVAIGGYAGYLPASIRDSVLIGSKAGYGVATKNITQSVCVGFEACEDGEGLNHSVAIGYKAADNAVSAENSIWIGDEIDAQSTTANNQMSIGNLLFSEGIDGSGTTVSTGGLGVGVVSPDTRLDVDGAITARELSSDPADPDEGSHVCWQSDGTGTGDDGDIICKITAGGSTKTTTLIDFSSL